MPDVENRRPLKSRGSNTAQSIAKWLSKKNITPNQISIFSVIFAAFSALSLVAVNHVTLPRWIFLIAAAVLIQCRLLCNLFDGMVAVEGGKGTASGELFNDMPDRFADAFILTAVGFSAQLPSLGWIAAILAVMTAYTRTLATSIGAPTNFCGPMAKQHRMALVTISSLLSCLEPLFNSQNIIFTIALGIIIFGSLITVFRRSRFAYNYLENNK